MLNQWQKWLTAATLAGFVLAGPGIAADKPKGSSGGGRGGGGVSGNRPAPRPQPPAPKPAPRPAPMPPKAQPPAPKPAPKPAPVVTPKPQPKPTPKPAPVVTPKPTPKPVPMPPAPKPEVKPKPKPEVKPQPPKPTPKPEVKPQPKPEVKPQPKPKPEVKPQPTPSPKPQTGLPRPRPQPDSKPQAPQTGGHKRTNTADGGYIENRGNHIVKYRADGTKEYMKSDAGRTVQYRKDGTKAQETKPGGHVTTFHKDGSKTVQRSGRPVYTETRVREQNNDYVRRTYVRNEVTYVRNYRTYVYGGYSYHTYVPVVTYDPWYYGYLYNPWRDPYVYRWTWHADPWCRYYGYYYRPYPVYYSPTYWITDYLISDLLASQYATVQQMRAERAAERAENAAERAEEAAAQPVSATQPVVLTDEVKAQIKQQVEEAIRAHERKESVPLTTVVGDTRRVFVVSDDLEVTAEETGEACSVTTGDVLRLREVPEADAAVAKMLVVTAKRESCRAGTPILVSLKDLQEFQNDFMEKVEEGMEKAKKELVDQKR